MKRQRVYSGRGWQRERLELLAKGGRFQQSSLHYPTGLLKPKIIIIVKSTMFLNQEGTQALIPHIGPIQVADPTPASVCPAIILHSREYHVTDENTNHSAVSNGCMTKMRR